MYSTQSARHDEWTTLAMMGLALAPIDSVSERPVYRGDVATSDAVAAIKMGGAFPNGVPAIDLAQSGLVAFVARDLSIAAGALTALSKTVGPLPQSVTVSTRQGVATLYRAKGMTACDSIAPTVSLRVAGMIRAPRATLVAGKPSFIGGEIANLPDAWIAYCAKRSVDIAKDAEKVQREDAQRDRERVMSGPRCVTEMPARVVLPERDEMTTRAMGGASVSIAHGPSGFMRFRNGAIISEEAIALELERMGVQLETVVPEVPRAIFETPPPAIRLLSKFSMTHGPSMLQYHVGDVISDPDVLRLIVGDPSSRFMAIGDPEKAAI